MSHSYRLNDCIVAVLDLLGAKDKVKCAKEKEKESEKIIDALHSVYEQTIDEMRSLDKIFTVSHPFKFKTFSDNIAIVIQFDNDNNPDIGTNPGNNNNKFDKGIDLANKLEKTASFISTFQLKLWCNHGLFFRGGLSVGKCYIDDLIVFGEGLIDAYEIESKISNYPRVVVSPKLIKSITRYPYVSKEFAQDFDGSYYVDYFRNWIISYPSAEKRQPHIDEVQKNLKEAQDDKIREKYQWMMEKINSIASK